MSEGKNRDNIRIDESEGEARREGEEDEVGDLEDGEVSHLDESEDNEESRQKQDEVQHNNALNMLDLPNTQFKIESPQKKQQGRPQLYPQTTDESPILHRNIDQSDQIQSKYTYDELSLQLEKALGKIKSKEKMKTQTFLDRVEYFQKKKHSQLQLRKLELQETAKQTAKHSLTNTHSQRILQQYQPIHERSTKILQEKKKKIERQQMQRRMKQEQEEKKIFLLSKQAKPQHLRSKEEFLSSINSWKEQKQRKIAAMAHQELKSEMDGVTFQPQINTNSKVMIKRIGKVPIQEREVKAKKVQADQECTFQPKLNKPKR